MAVPVSKRRKLSHSPSENEADDASFASFGDDPEDDVELDEKPEVGDELSDAGSPDAEEVADDGDVDDTRRDGDSTGTEGIRTYDKPLNGRSTPNTTHMKTDTSRKPPPKKDTSASNNAASMALTGGNFKSNMFKLQIDELLSEIRPKHGKKEAAAETTLHKLKSIIESLPAKGPMSIADAERDLIKTSRVAVPFPEPKPPHDAQYKLEFAKPANVNVVGSYALKMGARTGEVLELDLVVTMPQSLFQEKDYLNHRYFYKRAYYVAVLGAGLHKRAGSDLIVQFASFHGNPLKPIVTVTPKTGSTDKAAWRINVIPALSAKVFADDKLCPAKNAVRPPKASAGQESASSPSATPFYNSSIQADTQVTPYLKLIHAASTKSEAFKDACLLGRVWLRQRGLSSQITGGGFGNFEFTSLLAVLLHTGESNGSPALSAGYSSYQLFKATLQYLAAKDLVKQPAVLNADNVKIGTIKGHPMFFDGARSHNILFKMTLWSYSQLRTEARTSLSMLGDALFDQFENAFILREDVMHHKYDVTLTFPSKLLSPTSTDDHDILKRHSKLHNVLSRGLGDRISRITIRTDPQPAWELDSARPARDQKGDTVIAMTVNPANVSRAVDHGPPAEKKQEAADFRKFWGDKAELRRFKDGSILESLVWSGQARGQSILQQIVAYLLERHFGASVAEGLRYSGEGFTSLIRSMHGTTPFQAVMEAFKTLEDDIRSMQDLPLAIRQIAAADAQLRYSSTNVPLSNAHEPMRKPADVVVQFESSGRWPDDLVSIQRTKAAFLLHMSELFTTTRPDISSRVGLENTSIDVLNQAYLDVVYPSGAAFRLRIHHDREQTLIDRTLKDKGADARTRESAATALAAYKRDFNAKPAHTQAVQKLCTRHPALSPSIRLAKKWFASHLLAEQFHDALIELCVIRSFTQPWPWQVPSSAKTGFSRTLAFLARWDWREDPLVVDLGDLTPDAVQGMNTRFEAWRKLDPALNRVVLFAASSVDMDGTTWTDGAPSKVVAGRMSALARAATAEVMDKGLDLEPSTLFASPLDDYDFVIHLNQAFTAGSGKKFGGKKSSQFKNLVVQDSADPAMVGYEPIQLLMQELQELYGQSMMLFSGGGEGSVITGIWSPFAGRRAWKVNLGYSTTPLSGDGNAKQGQEAEVNRDGILGEIARLGGDMIDKIEVHSR